IFAGHPRYLPLEPGRNRATTPVARVRYLAALSRWSGKLPDMERAQLPGKPHPARLVTAHLAARRLRHGPFAHQHEAAPGHGVSGRNRVAQRAQDPIIIDARARLDFPAHHETSLPLLP